MRRVSVPRIQPQVQRQERETVALVLLDVHELVTPEERSGFDREHDHVAERDRDVSASREHEMREAAVAHIEEAAIAEARPCAGEPTEEMAERVRMVRDEVTECWRRSAPPTR